MILGMDPIIFVAWIGAILSAVLCIAYGLYYEFFKKDEEESDELAVEIEETAGETDTGKMGEDVSEPAPKKDEEAS